MDDLVNENIRFKEVLVIGPEGEQLGVMSRNQALNEAEKFELDLFCVSPGSKPPVCKIMDYGRHRYEQQKRLKEAKRNQHVTEIKALRLSPVIDKHDFDTKVRQATKWLEDGMKIKVDMRFRGRLITRVAVGKKVMEDFLTTLAEYGQPERAPKLEGNTMSVMISPKKSK